MDADDLRHFYPKEYEEEYGVMVLPTLETSVEACCEKFMRENKSKFISYRAVRDSTGELLPIDKVLVYARLNDVSECEASFIVDISRFARQLTPFGYVIDEQFDERLG